MCDHGNENVMMKGQVPIKEAFVKMSLADRNKIAANVDKSLGI